MGGRGIAIEPLEVRSLLSASLVALPESPGAAAAAPAVVAPAAAGEAEPDEGGVTLGEFAGVRFTARLGEFHFKTVDQSLNAVIDWGDGTHSDGQIVGSYATGEWYVRGTHTYAHTGTYRPDVKVFSHLVGNPNGPTG